MKITLWILESEGVILSGQSIFARAKKGTLDDRSKDRGFKPNQKNTQINVAKRAEMHAICQAIDARKGQTK